MFLYNGVTQQNINGFALVAVLWSIVVLSFIMLAFSVDTRMEIRMVKNLITHTQLEAIADGGIEIAIYFLLHSNIEKRWSPNGVYHEVGTKIGDLKVKIQDEGGKIDINMASKELLEKLLVSYEGDFEKNSSLAYAIINWREENNLKQLNGAVDQEYRDSGFVYKVKHALFESVRELRLVPGMTDDIYDAVQPAVTVYSQRAEPDKNTAPVQVLKTLSDLSEIELIEIFAKRELSQDSNGQPLESKVGVYTIQSDARNESGSFFSRYAIVRLTGNIEIPYLIYEIGRTKNIKNVTREE